MLLLRGVSWRYPTGAGPALGPVDLELRAGEFALLTGPTGCGKSTLLRLAAGLLQRHGHGALTGEIRVDDQDPAALAPAERARRLGFVSQEPSDQIVAGTLLDEVSFGMESVGWPSDELAPRALLHLRLLGLPLEPGRSPRALSGGQRQRLVVAAALSAGARLLLLDEPLSQLDPPGAQALLALLRETARRGVAVLMVEHRVDSCRLHVDRVIFMQEGRVVGDGPPPAARAPAIVVASEAPDPAEGPALVAAEGLTVRYGPTLALRELSIQVHAGERAALLGVNGSGKSSLIGALSGRLKVGGVRRAVRAVEVPQEADLTLFGETVLDELSYAPRERGLGPEAARERALAAARQLSVDDLLDRPPQALSRGQRLRVAVAASLTVDAPLLLLDEPTAGQDQEQVERMMAGLRAALGPGSALVFATHDLGLAERHATRRVVLEAAPETQTSDETVTPTPEARWLPDPRARLGLLLAASLAGLALDRPLSLGILCGLTALPLLLLRIERRWLGGGILAALTLVWSTTLSQGLFYADEPRVAVLSLGPLPLYREGLLHGLTQSLRLLAMTFGGLSLSVSTSPDRLFMALQALRVPFGVGFLAVTALRFVPEVGREWLTVRAARAARGRPIWRRAPWAWVAEEVALLRPVVARSLRRARALAESLDARGFDPSAPRSRYRPLTMGRGEAGILALALTAALLLLLARGLYLLYTAELLYVPALRPLYGWVRGWM